MTSDVPQVWLALFTGGGFSRLWRFSSVEDAEEAFRMVDRIWRMTPVVGFVLPRDLAALEFAASLSLASGFIPPFGAHNALVAYEAAKAAGKDMLLSNNHEMKETFRRCQEQDEANGIGYPAPFAAKKTRKGGKRLWTRMNGASISRLITWSSD